MNFHKGDLVIYVGPDSIWNKLEFKILNQHRSAMGLMTPFYDLEVVTSPGDLYKRGDLFLLLGDDLRLMGMQSNNPIPACPVLQPMTPLPAVQPSGWVTEWSSLDEAKNMFPMKQNTCDCGGFKTYNSMSPELHSSWCSSRSEK